MSFILRRHCLREVYMYRRWSEIKIGEKDNKRYCCTIGPGILFPSIRRQEARRRSKNREGLGRKRHLAKADQDEAALVFRFGGGRTSYPRVCSPIICK